ncbi:hypothetical protein [Aridibaculum aurantiacum]|uniref:hypothetical protein n=1 Tax=Aridibaculum aurantiacum TaxID=2810307 RepID=UPI001A95C3EB|nr:hypothetical protein [Aridibaculum aurantiacum]
MMKQWLILSLLTAVSFCAFSQEDTTVVYKNQSFTLTDVVIRNNFDYPAFIEYVKNDTTFYKAFRNLRVLSFSSYNDIILKNKKGAVTATMQSTTRQTYANGCRTMEVKDEKTTGDFYKGDGSYNYTTAEMYAGLFFTKGKVCGETNIVKGTTFNTRGKSGMAKHKEQLKQLFFNPGNRIPGLPMIANKVAIFDEDVAKLYDFKIDKQDYRGYPCYVFTIRPKKDLSAWDRSNIVIDEMTTWFNARTLEIIGRNYSLSYKTGVYDFDVDMEVQLEKVGELLVPKVLRYVGNWNVMFKKREIANFTATLFDFKR